MEPPCPTLLEIRLRELRNLCQGGKQLLLGWILDDLMPEFGDFGGDVIKWFYGSLKGFHFDFCFKSFQIRKRSTVAGNGLTPRWIRCPKACRWWAWLRQTLLLYTRQLLVRFGWESRLWLWRWRVERWWKMAPHQATLDFRLFKSGQVEIKDEVEDYLIYSDIICVQTWRISSIQQFCIKGVHSVGFSALQYTFSTSERKILWDQARIWRQVRNPKLSKANFQNRFTSAQLRALLFHLNVRLVRAQWPLQSGRP